MNEIPDPGEAPEAARLRGTLLGGTLQNTLGGSGRLALGFLLALVLGRLLGDQGLGVYFVAVGVAGILEAIAESGPRSATVRFVAFFLAEGRTDQARAALRTALVLSGLVGLALAGSGVLLAREGAARFLTELPPATGQAVWTLAVVSSVPLALTAVLLAGTRGTGWMAPSNVTDGLVVPAGRILLFLPLFAWGFRELGALWAYLGAALVGLGLAWWYLRRTFPGPGGTGWEWRAVVPFAAAQGGSGVLDVTLFWADTLIIAALLTAADAGVYGAAARLALIPTLFLTAFNTAFQPWAASLWARADRAGLGDIYRRVTRLSTGISVPFYLLLAAFPAPLLGVFGEEFRVGSTVLVILALAQIVNTATGPAANLLSMAGFPIWNFWNNAFLLVFNVAANLVLIPRLGIEGAAWAWAISLLVVNVARVVEARILTGLLPYDRRMLRIALLTLIGAALLATIRPWEVDTLGRAMLLGAGFGIAWLAGLLAVLPVEDRRMLRNLVIRS